MKRRVTLRRPLTVSISCTDRPAQRARCHGVSWGCPGGVVGVSRGVMGVCRGAHHVHLGAERLAQRSRCHGVSWVCHGAHHVHLGPERLAQRDEPDGDALDAAAVVVARRGARGTAVTFLPFREGVVVVVLLPPPDPILASLPRPPRHVTVMMIPPLTDAARLPSTRSLDRLNWTSLDARTPHHDTPP